MRCFVYKSLRKADTYLYLGQRDDFARVPESLRGSLGELSFVIEFELDAGRKLAREDAAVVKQNLAAAGFHLQFPPRMDALVPRAAASGVLPSTALAQSCASQDAQERPPPLPPPLPEPGSHGEH